ncbi:MAG: CrcB family protein [Pseudolysinimonas sp.]
MSLIAVLIGGALGTGLRLLVDLGLPHGGVAFPIGTLLVNVVGSFVLAVLVARVWPAVPVWLRAGLGPGLLGSFTTFSALAISAVELTSLGAGWMAALYVVVSLAGGLAAAALGLKFGRQPTPIGPNE